MTQEETQSQANEAKPRMPRRKYLWLGILAAVLVSVLLWNVYRRPSARANRVLTGAGLRRLPDSAENLTIERKGAPPRTQATFIGFNATETDIARFVDGSPASTSDEPLPLGNFTLGPKSSSWMKWDATTDGCVYHFDRGGASTWLAIDDDSSTVYVYVFRPGRRWWSKLTSYFPFVK